MHKYFNKDSSILCFAMPTTKVALLATVMLIISALFGLLAWEFSRISLSTLQAFSFIEGLGGKFAFACRVLLSISIVLFIMSICMLIIMKDADRIRHQIRKALFLHENGNPLHLKNGERLPQVTVKGLESGVFEVKLSAVSATVEDIANISSSVSSALNRKFSQYAVIRTNGDLAMNNVSFRIEDVTIDRTLYINEVMELKDKKSTVIPIQKNVSLDLETAGSILCSGKTRSGKTTGVISILLSALSWGRDEYGSEVIIIDPKMAELSRLPYTTTLDENGEARDVLNVMQHYVNTIKKRQQVLNDRSVEIGEAVKWWDMNMHVSYLFIDEYIALRSIFPKRITKENTDYNQQEFDDLLRTIITTGASAGCFVIISIAEASVESGGLPAMLRSAMTTKILFKPTISEARLLWDSEMLRDFGIEREYKAGDAWFSSTDGRHDKPTFVHFPVLNVRTYAELGRLLVEYYKTM